MSDTAVMLLSFGGPERMEDVRPFLENVLRGRPVPRDRIEEVVSHYACFDGRSPLNALTRAQGLALAQTLRTRGHDLPVVMGMRNWHPFIQESIAQLVEAGVRHIVGVIMAAYNTEASDARYRASVDEALRGLGEAAPRVSYTPRFGAHQGFIEANACHVARTLARVPEAQRTDTPLLFTAHSIPVAMAQASPYVAQIEATARAVAAAVGHARWRLCYQSRSGSPREPWLEPDVNAAIREEAAQGATHVVLSPVGFVADHVEVLYDLDVEAQTTAREAGVQLWRAQSAQSHPAFIAALADGVVDALRTAAGPGEAATRGAPA